MQKTIRRIFKVKFCGVLLSFLIISGCNVQNSNNQTVVNALQKKLDSLVLAIKVPGANLSILLPNGEKLSFSSGFSDLEKSVKMTPESKMLSGSIGKTYVAAIAFQLIQDKKLKLTDKVEDFFKDEKWISQIPNIKDLTVEMLLTHTSGLPRYEYYDGVWIGLKQNPDKVWTVYDRMSFILNAEPLHQPGKAWAYSDSNYILLGAIIEKITGKDYYECFKDLISKFDDLKNTLPANQRYIKKLASGYSGFLTKYNYPEKVVENEKVIFNPQMEWCGGGVASTADDLAAWAKHLYEGDVVSPESVQKMVTPTEFVTELADGAKYGYGAIISTCGDNVYWGHQGFFPGFRSIVQYSPKYKFAIAFQINRDNPDTKQSLNQLTKPFKDLVILYLQKK